VNREVDPPSFGVPSPFVADAVHHKDIRRDSFHEHYSMQYCMDPCEFIQQEQT
jgi:hypothetical protein